MLATSQLHTPGGLAKDAGSRRFHHQGAGGSRGLLVSVGQARCPAGRCQQAADVSTTSGWDRTGQQHGDAVQDVPAFSGLGVPVAGTFCHFNSKEQGEVKASFPSLHCMAEAQTYPWVQTLLISPPMEQRLRRQTVLAIAMP